INAQKQRKGELDLGGTRMVRPSSWRHESMGRYAVLVREVHGTRPKKSQRQVFRSLVPSGTIIKFVQFFVDQT
ncbi:MAG: hypothetical protein FD151_665, partial [bacterium]